ncbi:hypothetical protein NE237_022335 [Protea cynaroides]|uniref:RING-type domain-containing protein n=1 Tax=Protea cynaroides TaxID=273540 RepID=A0A9Q0HBW5_9MAGN|nr:hypothetical protein NE237_022335 [Protea cynaroides]
MPISYRVWYGVEAIIPEEMTISESQDSTTDQTSMHFSFSFRDVRFMRMRSSEILLLDRRLIADKEKFFPFDSLYSYRTCKRLIRDVLLHVENIQFNPVEIKTLKEEIAIIACNTFRDNQARNVRTLGFNVVIDMQTMEDEDEEDEDEEDEAEDEDDEDEEDQVEDEEAENNEEDEVEDEEDEDEEDEDTRILREIIEATMDMGPSMVPASQDSIEKLLNTRKFKEEEEIGGEACTVCLEDFSVGLDEVKVMPCGHAFHGNCIIKWLQQSHFCPLCRFSMPVGDAD